MDWPDASQQAHDVLDRGLTLAPEDADLLRARGNAYLLDLDYSAAEASYRASLASDRLHPNAHRNHLALGELALARGNLTDAIRHPSC